MIDFHEWPADSEGGGRFSSPSSSVSSLSLLSISVLPLSSFSSTSVLVVEDAESDNGAAGSGGAVDVGRELPVESMVVSLAGGANDGESGLNNEEGCADDDGGEEEGDEEESGGEDAG